jgi:flagellar hook capping protein FlgD
VSERSRSAVLISVLAVSLLLAATAAAIVVTQHLRDEGPVVSSTRLKTRHNGDYRACFQLTRDDTVQVSIVDASDQVVRVLEPGTQLTGSDSQPDTPKAGAHCFDWDGTDAAGQAVPPGVYRMRLRFQRLDRVLTPGEHLTIGVTGVNS